MGEEEVVDEQEKPTTSTEPYESHGKGVDGELPTAHSSACHVLEELEKANGLTREANGLMRKAHTWRRGGR